MDNITHKISYQGFFLNVVFFFTEIETQVTPFPAASAVSTGITASLKEEGEVFMAGKMHLSLFLSTYLYPALPTQLSVRNRF